MQFIPYTETGLQSVQTFIFSGPVGSRSAYIETLSRGVGSHTPRFCVWISIQASPSWRSPLHIWPLHLQHRPWLEATIAWLQPFCVCLSGIAFFIGQPVVAKAFIGMNV